MDADQRRLSLILAHRAAVIVEAPAGFGKSQLLARVAEATDSPIVTTPNHLAAVADAPPPVVLLDLEDLDPDAVRRIADHPDVEMLVVAARVVGRRVREILGRYDHLELTSDDLAMTDAEIGLALDHDGSPPDDAIVDLIRTQTAGWPAPVLALAEHGRGNRNPILDDPTLLRRGLAHHPVVDRLLRDVVASLPEALAHSLVRFGPLDAFTATAFDAVTEAGTVRRLVEHGVPVIESADGWLHLPPVLRTHLGGEITPSDAERIAPQLARSGGLLAAARTLVASGSLFAAERLLLDARRHQLDDIEPRALLGLLDALGPTGRRAETGLIRAHVHESLGEIAEARRIVDELAATLDPTDDDWISVRLEQLRHAAMADDVGSDDELVLDLTTSEHHTRLRELLGLRAAQDDDPVRVEEAIGLLETAAGEWQALGDPSRAASVLRLVASIPLTHLGRYPEALDAIARARRLGTHRLHDRALATVLTLRLAGFAGRTDLIERERPGAASLAATVQLPWLDHFIAAAMVHVAAFADRADDALEWATRAEHTLGGLRDHSMATLFHADTAMAMALVGRLDEADRHLDLARSRRADNPIEVALAEITVAARHGDPTTARRLLAGIEADPHVPESRRWRPRLEVALAAGDAPAIESARAAAQLVGLRELADRLSAPADDTISIRVLGGLEIRRGGQLITNPTGKPAELLTLLVLRGGRVTAEQAIDILWDDVPNTEQGLRRLKNPVNRLREAVGADAIVRSSVGLHLGPGVDTDLARFTAATGRAMGCGGGRETSLAAVDALNLYEPLLPDEPPSDLVAARAADLVATASGLFDLVLRQPTPDRPSSSWLLDTARRIDLWAESWFTVIAGLAVDEHNLVNARQAIALARAAAVELDLPDNPEIEVISARLSPEQRHVHH
ncbi:MAG: hypothetical protein AAF081_03495 [Actinomycetota bacterium]